MIFRKRRDAAVDPDESPELEVQSTPMRRRWWRRIVAGVLLAFMLIIGWLGVTAPVGRALEPLESPALVLTASNGTPIARRGGYKGEPVDVTKLPDYVGRAFVAIEDRRFYDHIGIDLRGILRAAKANAEAGRVVQGGSTLTQQLAKTSFLSLDRSFSRKAQEVFIALWLEAWLTKDEILSRYLSSVYFGDGAYGIRAAALQYFDKTPEKLTLGEAAMLAGLVKAPSRLAPTSNYEAARARGKLVIAAMKDQDLITEGQWRRASRAVVRPGRKDLPGGTYFTDWVWPQAMARAGEAYGEVRVETTLDAQLQRLAERVVKQHLARGSGQSAGQAALVAMRPDGRVVAMVGGREYASSAFNRAVQAKRQPGSAFKLFVYLAALRHGMEIDDLITDEKVTLGDWSPKNSGNKYRGEITLKKAFAVSSNVAAARLTNTVGTGAVRDAARDLGIKDKIANDLTIALGTSTMSLIDLTAAYAAVAGTEAPVRSYGVERSAKTGIFSSIARVRRTANLPERRALRAMLRDAVDYGTGRAARLPIAAFGKTGTTQDSRDALFVGFAGTGEDALVVGIWVGNDDNSPMRGVSGSGLPALMWRDFMSAALPEVAKILERKAEEQREREAERRAAELTLSELLGPDFAAAMNGEPIDLSRASRMLLQLGDLLATLPEDAADIRDRAQELADRLATQVDTTEQDMEIPPVEGEPAPQ